jgi:predicted ATPase
VIQSPILVGRDDLLSLTRRRLSEAQGGRGQLLFVAGEAGIGKTRLLGAIENQAREAFAVVRAAAFPGDVESSAALLLDLASDLASSTTPPLRELGRNLGARVREMPDGVGDSHRRRRLLLQDVVDLMTANLGETPLLVILEDLHWADELSLDALGHLAARIRTRPILVAGSYRSDELFATAPMRNLRARVLGQRLAEEIRLPRLDLADTATMTSALLGRATPDGDGGGHS